MVNRWVKTSPRSWCCPRCNFIVTTDVVSPSDEVFNYCPRCGERLVMTDNEYGIWKHRMDTCDEVLKKV